MSNEAAFSVLLSAASYYRHSAEDGEKARSQLGFGSGDFKQAPGARLGEVKRTGYTH